MAVTPEYIIDIRVKNLRRFLAETNEAVSGQNLDIWSA